MNATKENIEMNEQETMSSQRLNRLRQRAYVRGCKLVKSRTARDSDAPFMVVDIGRNAVVFPASNGDEFGATLDEVEDYLSRKPAAS